MNLQVGILGLGLGLGIYGFRGLGVWGLGFRGDFGIRTVGTQALIANSLDTQA